MTQKIVDDEICYRLLKLFEENPVLSQRNVAEALGVSVGKANYCVHALIDRGWVQMFNFGRGGNKAAYFYKLTATGVAEKAGVTRRILGRKLEEHDQVTTRIETLRRELDAVEQKG